MLKVNPEIKHLAIEGHTDNRGANDLNEKLSNDRANSVMQYLVDKGIDAGTSQLETIGAHWLSLCDEADLGQVDRTLFWGRQFLNPFAFYGLDGSAAPLAERAAAIRAAG